MMWHWEEGEDMHERIVLCHTTRTLYSGYHRCYTLMIERGRIWEKEKRISRMKNEWCLRACARAQYGRESSYYEVEWKTQIYERKLHRFSIWGAMNHDDDDDLFDAIKGGFVMMRFNDRCRLCWYMFLFSWYSCSAMSVSLILVHMLCISWDVSGLSLHIVMSHWQLLIYWIWCA
jgi:hypothetical protein